MTGRVAERLRRAGSAALARVRSPRSPSAPPAGEMPAPHAELELTFDGRDLLNWRCWDAKIAEVHLVDPDGACPDVRSPAIAQAGPPHGEFAVSDLVGDRYAAHVLTPQGVVPAIAPALHREPQTHNHALRAHDRLTIDRAEDGSLLIVSQPVEAGVVRMEAAHGVLRLDAGPAEAGSRLRLRQRGGAGVHESDPRGELDGFSRMVLTSADWGVLELPEDGSVTVWNLYLLPPGASADPIRLRWTGSALAVPRSSLRMRAMTSRLHDGRAVVIRPYWTRDQFLALEIRADAAPESYEGAAV